MSIYRTRRDRIERPAFAASGLNFAHYLTFRRIDLRRPQRRLMVLGLSSLGRSEGHVLATLDSIAWALARMAGQDSRRGPTDRQFLRSERQLRLNMDELFGPPHEGRAGRIMVTLGREAAEDPRFRCRSGRTRGGCGAHQLEAAQIPAIWATQVLEGLIQQGLPSRGEMTDAAIALRAECVVLNKGPNLGAGAGALDRLLKRMGEHQAKKTPTLRALHSWPERFADGGRPDGWQAVDPVWPAGNPLLTFSARSGDTEPLATAQSALFR